MYPNFLTLLIFVSCLQIVYAIVGSGCERRFDVNNGEFGVVYEYFQAGNNVSCSFQFHGQEEHRVMLAISHIGLLPTKSDECKPELIITDVLPDGKKATSTVICDEHDAKDGFVSSTNMATVDFRGPSAVNGILLLQYWFVQDVTLVSKDDDTLTGSTTVSPMIGMPNLTKSEGKIGCSGRKMDFLKVGIEAQCDASDTFRPLQCSKWGSEINLSRCMCVDVVTGEVNGLKPPYCLVSSEQFETKCLQELAKFRHTVTLINEAFLLPPSCDTSGNYDKLQCTFVYKEDICKCVDQITGEVTDLAPPACESPLTTPRPLTTDPLTAVSLPEPKCFVFFCTLVCESGSYAIDENGCQMCACNQTITEQTAETCQQARTRSIEENLYQFNQEDPSPPYSWIPECQLYLYERRQRNHLAGYFCADQETGKPSGKDFPTCDTYKACVNNRIMGFSKALRKSGYKQTSKEMKGLLSKPNDANSFQNIWNLMSDVERENIFSKSSIFVPSCNAYGDFNPLQCNYATGNCWCVDVFGAQIEDSRRSITQQMPDCTKFVRWSNPVPLYLEDMYDFTFQVNDSWGIHATFDNFNESSKFDFYNFWTKDGVPVPLMNEEKYSLDTWYDEQKFTSGLSVYDTTEMDAGSYVCHLVKLSIGYVYSSPSATAELFDDYKYDYDSYNYGDECDAPDACNKVCAFGYSYKRSCALCKCNERKDIIHFKILEEIKFVIATSFGTNDGRCEAKRQWIIKNIKETNLEEYTRLTHFDIPPSCDVNGNFAKVQHIVETGPACVDVMTGQPNGRTLPDCRELSQCSKDNILGMETYLNAFLKNESVTDDIIANVAKSTSLREKNIIYYNSYLDFDAPTYVMKNETSADLLPVMICNQQTGRFFGNHMCSDEEPWNCLCVDVYGNRKERSLVGTNQTEYYCGELMPDDDATKVSLKTANDTYRYLSVHMDTTVTLLCATETTVDGNNIYGVWRTPNGYLQQVKIVDNRIQMIGDGINDFTLQITNINNSDEGSYYCEVYNTISGRMQSANYYITVYLG
ncbi:uncharacterized protein [Antedon mediterranea]|uniref:uncharacterized protein n=1 Tax=Antedon mediterranea TaxID=105859 RepID=UPI003AF58EBF